MKALFRVDASLEIGQGHLIRCLTLAQYLQSRGWNCTFACSEHCCWLVKRILGTRFSVISLPDSPSEQIDALPSAIPSGVNLLIVDHYSLAIEFEQACRIWAENILVIDDLADREHDADILLDQTYGRTVEEYRYLTSPECKLLVGSSYAILRPMFLHAREYSLKRRDSSPNNIERILVAMGSSDPGNVTEIVLDAIMQSKIGSTVDVVLSANAPSLDNIRRRLETIPSGLLHVETQDMAKLMSRADIAIGAGGTTSWERCCVGLPSLVITTASNQELIARNLELAGAVLKLGESTDLQPSSIANSIKNLNNNPAHLRSMSMKARAACDGLGLSRLGNYL